MLARVKGGRGAWILLTLAATGVGTGLAWPVLAAPVTGDDRWLYLFMGGAKPWSVLQELRSIDDWWTQRVPIGRVNVVTLLERRLAGRAVFDVALTAGVAISTVLGALKWLLMGISALTMGALAKSLRWRDGAGELVALPGRVVGVLTIATGLLLALGAQPQIPEYFLGLTGRNGWLSYPTSTYGAIVNIFGVTALMLWLSRIIARPGRHWLTALVLVVAAAIGAVTNFRYELTFVAAPLVLVALVLFPVTAQSRARAGRRAKWLVGGAYFAGFAPLFVGLRVYLNHMCEVGKCYTGVEPKLGFDTLRAFWVNFASSVPGTGSRQLAASVESTGVGADGIFVPTWWSVVLGLAVIAVLVMVWRIGLSRPEAEDDTTAYAEARLLAGAALLCLLGALGSSLLMALSKGAGAGQITVGLPYRHSVVTWMGQASALVFALAAWGRTRTSNGRRSWLAMAVVAGVAAMVLAPANVAAGKADRHLERDTTAVLDEVIVGDTSRAGLDRRCDLARRLPKSAGVSAPTLLTAANQAFRARFDQPFCPRKRIDAR